MQIICRHCRRVLDYAGAVPRYCSHCGESLHDTIDLNETKAYAHDEPGAADVEVGASLAGYRLLRRLGEGGMGVVWEAEQEHTGRRVALKLLSPRIPRTPETLERFLREGRSAAALSHPRTTFVFDAGEHDGQPYIAMELMPGQTLADLVHREGPLSVAQAVDHILDVMEGLQAAHAQGLVHRDVKPSNCFLDAAGRIKIGDFGLAKSLVADVNLTRTGAFLGTLQYAAPEQTRGQGVDERTDAYAVGATLFFLLTGRAPFEGDAAAVIAQIASERPPRASDLRPDVPRTLSRIIDRTLNKDPKRRFADLAQLRQALLPFATGGVSIGEAGRRVAAYVLDAAIAALVGQMATVLVHDIWILACYLEGKSWFTATTPPVLEWLGTTTYVAAIVSYFVVAEAVWGRAVGKWLLGLRVIDLQGQPPALWRAALRGLMIPGAGEAIPYLGATADVAALSSWTESGALASLITDWGPVLPGMLLTLLFLTTARAKNGYRGLHELLSGTRVVRLRPVHDADQFDLPAIAAIAPSIAARTFGPYRELGLLGYSGTATVLLARDDKLRRSVWVYVDPSGNSAVPEWRRKLLRITRPRWLQSGHSNDAAWHVFEAVSGAPLPAVVADGKGLDWTLVRRPLLELADELATALADQSLPDPLTIDQVWVLPGGQARLLDAPVQPQSEAAVSPFGKIPAAGEEHLTQSGMPPGAPSASPTPPAAAAARLLQHCAVVATAGQRLPSHAQQFVEALTHRPAEAATSSWAVEELRALSDRRTTLDWDDRLGILSVSATVESALYSVATLLLAMLIWTVPALDSAGRAATLLIAAWLTPAVVGYAARGGPVFLFLGMVVNDPQRRRAGRWRCAWRNFIAWAPMMIMQVAGTVELVQPGFEESPAKWEESFAAGDWQTAVVGKESRFVIIYAFLGCATVCTAPLYALGVVLTVLCPRKGDQDLLARTHLVPR